jgi:hypothetical protein
MCGDFVDRSPRFPAHKVFSSLLTPQRILAARQIKFIPATEDGRPISMQMELQYNFNLY